MAERKVLFQRFRWQSVEYLIIKRFFSEYKSRSIMLKSSDWKMAIDCGEKLRICKEYIAKLYKNEQADTSNLFVIYLVHVYEAGRSAIQHRTPIIKRRVWDLK